MHWQFNAWIKVLSQTGKFLSKGECQLIRKTAFDEIGGYSEEIVVGEDCNIFFRLRKLGKIRFLNELLVYHSPRRFRTQGYIRVLLAYAREGFWLIVLGRSCTEKWKEIR